MNPAQFADLLDTALSCVCEQMEDVATEDEDFPGCPCVQFVSPGEPVIDCCSDDCGPNGGRLTVHMESVFPSDNFPEPSPGSDPCKAATWVAAIVVTVARCVPALSELGEGPSPEVLAEAARIQALDAWAVMTALGCCLVESGVGSKRKRRVQVVGSTPLVEEGGCVGLEVRANVEAGSVCACTQGS